MIEHISMNESMMLDKGIKQAVKWMKASKNVVFLGVGSSFTIIQGIENKFLKDEKKIRYIDSEQIDETLLEEDTLLIAVSYSGSTREILDVVNLARIKKVKTIGITAFKDSPIMSVVHIPLICAPMIIQNHNTMYRQPSLSELLESICQGYKENNNFV